LGIAACAASTGLFQHPARTRLVFRLNGLKTTIFGDQFHWVLDTRKVELRLTDGSGKTIKTWR